VTHAKTPRFPARNLRNVTALGSRPASIARCRRGIALVRRQISLWTINESVWVATLQQVLVALLHQPFRTSQMAVPGLPRPSRLFGGIDMKHDPRNLSPIRSLRLGVEQAQIRDGVLFVVAGQSGGVRRLVGDSRIKRSLRHWHPSYTFHNGPQSADHDKRVTISHKPRRCWH
jgi:hypothetical protein